MPHSASFPPAAVPAPAAVSPAARRGDRPALAILLMILVSLIFSVQDALSRYLGSNYPPVLVVMLRYWFFALFAIALAARQPGGLRAAVRTRHPWLQIARGLLLVTEILVMLVAFVKLGLIESHAVFIAHPLIIVALSGPVLGERIGWRRWAAVAVGFVGILIILQPGVRVFSPWAALPLLSALMFAVYVLLTRMVSAKDDATTSLFWTGIAGVAGITVVGLGQMQPLAPADWLPMATLCVTGVAGHYLLIRAYSLAEASSLQPYSYTQLIWVSLIGLLFLGETVGANVVIGMIIIVAAGLFTWWRERQKRAQLPPA